MCVYARARMCVCVTMPWLACIFLQSISLVTITINLFTLCFLSQVLCSWSVPFGSHKELLATKKKGRDKKRTSKVTFNFIFHPLTLLSNYISNDFVPLNSIYTPLLIPDPLPNFPSPPDLVEGVGSGRAEGGASHGEEESGEVKRCWSHAVASQSRQHHQSCVAKTASHVTLKNTNALNAVNHKRPFLLLNDLEEGKDICDGRHLC